MLFVLAVKLINKGGTYRKGEMRSWDNISEQNDLWLEETAGNRSKLKEYYNCEFKPIAIKSGKGSEPVMKVIPKSRTMPTPGSQGSALKVDLSDP